MPCIGGPSAEQAAEDERKRNLPIRVACEACRVLEKLDLLTMLSREGQKWFKEHKSEDKARIEAEKKEVRTRLERGRREKLKNFAENCSPEELERLLGQVPK